MTFLHQKQKQLAKLDKSHVGAWDKKIVSLCNKLNRNKEYYTTSSCAGRIILIKSSETKEPTLFVFRTHEKTDFHELKSALVKAKKKGNVIFQQEPCQCRSDSIPADNHRIAVSVNLLGRGFLSRQARCR